MCWEEEVGGCVCVCVCVSECVCGPCEWQVAGWVARLVGSLAGGLGCRQATNPLIKPTAADPAPPAGKRPKGSKKDWAAAQAEQRAAMLAERARIQQDRLANQIRKAGGAGGAAWAGEG